MSSIENNTFSRLLRISNIHSVNPNDTSTDFTVNLNRMTETNNIVRISCKSVTFPNNGYNIHTSGALKNNVFNFEVPLDTTYTYTLTEEGFYTTQELINILLPVIQQAVDITDPTNIVSMTQSSVSGKIAFSVSKNTVALQFPGLLGFGGLNLALGNTIDTGIIINTNPATLSETPDLYGLKNVYVHSLTLADGNLVDGDVENHNILAEIPVDVPFGQICYYRANDVELESVNYTSVRNFDNIQITLRDLNNNIIKLNGGKVIITLKLYYL